MKINIDIPSKLSEITLEKYQKFLKILDTNANNKNADHFIAMKMLEIFCNMPTDVLMNYKIKDISKITSTLEAMLAENPDLVQSFKIGDTEFGFIPNLDEMTFGEYIDLETYISDWDNIHKAMAVLYRPINAKIKDKYSIEEYRGDAYHPAMLKTPMDAVFSSVVFFYNLGRDLVSNLANYLEGEEKVIYQHYLTSIENGDGTTPSIYSVMEILQNTKKSQV